ncbi:Helix-turn-helix domain [Micromonospora nigra]|uniref:Helix-turn-helix domain n=1 Tax=Micromonospora nigra TaxID=145857 RepID=A0A1C6SAN1_9ACTN|nr:Helix-turn-helix domain [Micromonospora nigra]
MYRSRYKREGAGEDRTISALAFAQVRGRDSLISTVSPAQAVEVQVNDPIDIELLGRLVHAERLRRGRLSLRAAAEQAEVPFNTLARVEKGDLPDLANFRRIVHWLGLPPERFFQPPRIRTENTPELIAHHLARDPNLTDAAAEKIAGLVRELYTSLVGKQQPIRVHLRASATFKPEASRKLSSLLQQLQQKLESMPRAEH